MTAFAAGTIVAIHPSKAGIDQPPKLNFQKFRGIFNQFPPHGQVRMEMENSGVRLLFVQNDGKAKQNKKLISQVEGLDVIEKWLDADKL